VHENVWYLLRVAAIDRTGAPPAIRVHLAFLEDVQVGRTHVASLPVPVRPAGLAADFFLSCGVEVVAGGTVTPKAVVGKVVRAQFAPGAPAGAWQIVRFALPEGNDAPHEADRRA